MSRASSTPGDRVRLGDPAGRALGPLQVELSHKMGADSLKLYRRFISISVKGPQRRLNRLGMHPARMSDQDLTHETQHPSCSPRSPSLARLLWFP